MLGAFDHEPRLGGGALIARVVNTDAEEFAWSASTKLVVLDTQSGTSTAAVDIVPKVDQIAYDATAGFLYCAGADKMSVVSTSGTKVASVGEIATAATAKNVAVDSSTHAVWTTYTDGKSSFAKSWLPAKP